MLHLTIDVSEIEAIAALLRRAALAAPAATARALNRAGTQSRTAIIDALAGQTGLKKGEIRKAFSFVPASSGRLAVRIVARGPHTSLSRFGARQTARGVSAAPWAKRRVFPSTFIVAKLGGHVYVRTSRKRFPIKKLYGPAIPNEMVKDAAAQAFHDTAPRVLLKRLEHELGRLLDKR